VSDLTVDFFKLQVRGSLADGELYANSGEDIKGVVACFGKGQNFKYVISERVYK
jgi:hypothetical protein